MKVSIIMAAYNAEKYIDEAIDSVVNQTHQNWELLIINDGSIDETQNIIDQYQDPRIKNFNQGNKGVSAARNIGLDHMKGDFFCFLDADDILPNHSISERIKAFLRYPNISFLDGRVNYMDAHGKTIVKTYLPTLKGEVYSSLLKLESNCFLGNTWMIRRESNQTYKFDVSLKYCEDLYFYLSISEGKQYDYVTHPVLVYRQSEGSAMTNIKGLESGYIQLIQKIRSLATTNSYDILYLKLKIAKIMILSHLFDGEDWKSAVNCPFRIFKA